MAGQSGTVHGEPDPGRGGREERVPDGGEHRFVLDPDDELAHGFLP
ncbi:hypothetical protein ACFYN9_21560 [Streptomyces collinus]